jgi:beta-lactamase class C
MRVAELRHAQPHRKAFTARDLRRAAAALVIAGLTSAAAAADAGSSSLRDAVDAVIRPLMARYDIPGMAVALTVDGRAQVLAYGLASREAGTPVGDATLFEIGSVTKTLTATLATYAQATGKLSLSDHPSRYVTRLKGRPIDEATLLHLATYTAGGLPLQFPDDVGDDDAAAIDYLAAWKADAKPGTEREYSNPSLGLLGFATGVALGPGFVRSMEEQLLPRLGLRSTHLNVPAAAMADYAWGYVDRRPVRAGPGPFADETYGIKTTAADLIRFVQANIDPRALEPTLRSAVEATHVGWFRTGAMVQGLGWEQYAWPVSREALLGGNAAEMIEQPSAVIPCGPQEPQAPRLFDKTGSTRGFGAYVAFVPSRRIGIVMLANRNYPIPARVEAGYRILEELARSPSRLDK